MTSLQANLKQKLNWTELTMLTHWRQSSWQSLDGRKQDEHLVSESNIGVILNLESCQ